MPTRTFTTVNVQNFNISNNNVSVPPWVIGGTTFGNFTATITFSQGPQPGSLILASNFTSDITGNFDFQQFPAIPLTAKIRKVITRLASSAVCSADAASAAPAVLGCQTFVSGSVGALDGTSYNVEGDDDTDGSGVALSASSDINATQTLTSSRLEFDYQLTDPGYITYDELVTLWEDIAIRASGDVQAAAANTGDKTCSFSGTILITGISLEVIYDEGDFNWEIENGATPIGRGDKVTIAGDSGLDTIDSIQIRYTDGAGDHICTVPKIDFFFQSPTELIFFLPSCMHDFAGTATVLPVGNGTIFSGPLFAGTIEVIYADGSGVYTIVPGKTTDTLYDRDGTTEDVAIIQPMGRTGFVGQ